MKNIIRLSLILIFALLLNSDCFSQKENKNTYGYRARKAAEAFYYCFDLSSKQYEELYMAFAKYYQTKQAYIDKIKLNSGGEYSKSTEPYEDSCGCTELSAVIRNLTRVNTESVCLLNCDNEGDGIITVGVMYGHHIQPEMGLIEGEEGDWMHYNSEIYKRNMEKGLAVKFIIKF